MPDSTPAAIHGDAKFIEFCRTGDAVVRGEHSIEDVVKRVAGLMGELTSHWRMPDERYLRCQPDAMYGSYLLYLNEEKTFNVVLDVFAPGQAAIIHNHLCWCAFACLDGVEKERLYSVDESFSEKPEQTLERICPPGQVRSLGDGRNLFHQVECASESPAVSLHVYGADIGRLERDMWDDSTARYVTFSSDYSNTAAGLPTYCAG